MFTKDYEYNKEKIYAWRKANPEEYKKLTRKHMKTLYDKRKAAGTLKKKPSQDYRMYRKTAKEFCNIEIYNDETLDEKIKKVKSVVEAKNRTKKFKRQKILSLYELINDLKTVDEVMTLTNALYECNKVIM